MKIAATTITGNFHLSGGESFLTIFIIKFSENPLMSSQYFLPGKMLNNVKKPRYEEFIDRMECLRYYNQSFPGFFSGDSDFWIILISLSEGEIVEPVHL